MSAAPSGLSLKCPVCGAGFRAAAECPRCRSDLSAVMRLAARAYHARQEARSALLAGDVKLALQHQAEARRLHAAGTVAVNEELLMRFADSPARVPARTTATPTEVPAAEPMPAPMLADSPTPATPSADAAPRAREHLWSGIATWLHTLWERNHSR